MPVHEVQQRKSELLETVILVEFRKISSINRLEITQGI